MKFLSILLLVTLPFWALSQDTLSKHYKIYSTAKQKLVSVDEIVNDMDNADVYSLAKNIMTLQAISLNLCYLTNYL